MSGAESIPPPAAALFPPPEARRQVAIDLAAELATIETGIAAGAVTPTLDMAQLRADLEGFDFRAPRPLEPTLQRVVEWLRHGLVQLTHPRYFGLFNPAPSFPARCADAIAAAFNPQLATWTTSPVAVEIEAHVIRAIGRRAGLPAGAGGHFTTGGAEANATALTCALTAAHPDFAQSGARAFPGRPTVYISREAHLAWIKIAHQAGIGRDAVRLVATDGSGRIDPRSLADGIAADRAEGAVPVLVVATAGTTGAGMIDPLPACADAAAQAGAWYHVDAAWGGGLIASERHRHRLAGIERAHSVTIDAHKWLATTMGCGMFLVRDPAILSAAFRVSTSYMPSNEAGRDPYVTSAQWSRRFLGLRLFLSLAAAGWDGHGQHVDRAIVLAERLAGLLRRRGWRVVNDSPLAVLCLDAPAGSADPATIVRRVLASGEAWISTTEHEARTVIRACVTHGETSANDLDRLVAALGRARQSGIPHPASQERFPSAASD